MGRTVRNTCANGKRWVEQWHYDGEIWVVGNGDMERAYRVIEDLLAQGWGYMAFSRGYDIRIPYMSNINHRRELL